MLALAGCGGGDGDAQVRMAERDLAGSQEDLAGAQAELAAQVDAFCRNSAAYVTALDRYGDLINETTPTVGDVKSAGAELAEPRSDVIGAAEGIRSAREDVAAAEKEVAEATAALAAAHGKAPQSSGPPDVTASPPSAQVSRVKQADAEFAAAQAGVTDQTPLREASERFNAAAVALEMAWLSLLGETGCVSEDQHGKARDYTLAVQKALAEAGYYKSEVDGVYGPETVAAVQAVQKAHDLPGTGTVDRATDAALQSDLKAKGGAAAEEAVAATAAVQQTLKLAGFWTGPVDGVWTDELTAALKKFQTSLGVEPSGTVDAATVAAMEQRAAESKQPQPSQST
ncbi:peptidoglycan-binding protein [Actinoplanes sp. NPDC000266]